MVPKSEISARVAHGDFQNVGMGGGSNEVAWM